MKRLQWLIGSAAVVALGIAAACGSSAPTPTPIPTPSTSPIVDTSTTTPTPTPPDTDYRLVYREYGETQDTIWAALPTDPTHKLVLAVIPHRDGYGVKATISPDGSLLAYLSLPDSAISTDSSQAEAYVIDLQSKDQTPVQLAGGVDYNYTPLWSPDSHLLYMRQYAGPEFLAANVLIVRVAVIHVPNPSPKPTPTPVLSPGFLPAPTPSPVELVMQASVSNVLSFAPIGFADDGDSMIFLQEQGGTGGGTLVGLYSPATTKAVDAMHKLAVDLWNAAEALNVAADNDAIVNGQPTPETTITPAPTPTPNARFVVQISNQAALNAILSPDMHSVAYLSQVIDDSGEIHTQPYLADLIQATTAPFAPQGAAPGDFLSLAWYPDGRLTLSLLPSDGSVGQTFLANADGTGVIQLPPPDSGFDEAISWTPDGNWLLVSHNTGKSPVNPGEGSLQLLSLDGQRITVQAGANNYGTDSFVGWVTAESLPTPAPGGG